MSHKTSPENSDVNVLPAPPPPAAIACKFIPFYRNKRHAKFIYVYNVVPSVSDD